MAFAGETSTNDRNWLREYKFLAGESSVLIKDGSRISNFDAWTTTMYIKRAIHNRLIWITGAIVSDEIKETYRKEIELIIKFLLLHFRIKNGGKSIGDSVYGCQLQNKPSTGGYFMLTTLTLWKYVYEKYLESKYDKIGKLTRVLRIVNFLAFVVQGRYKTLSDRLLGTTITSGHLSRDYEVDILNRTLIWSELTEFVELLMTLIDFPKIFRFVKAKSQRATQETSHEEKAGEICQFCLENVNIPYKTNCEHVYCYYCSFIAKHNYANCRRCNQIITSITPI